MSRASQSPEPVTVAASNDVLTALSALSLVMVVLGVIVLFIRAKALSINILPF